MHCAYKSRTNPDTIGNCIDSTYDLPLSCSGSVWLLNEFSVLSGYSVPYKITKHYHHIECNAHRSSTRPSIAFRLALIGASQQKTFKTTFFNPVFVEIPSGRFGTSLKNSCNNYLGSGITVWWFPATLLEQYIPAHKIFCCAPRIFTRMG